MALPVKFRRPETAPRPLGDSGCPSEGGAGVAFGSQGWPLSRYWSLPSATGRCAHGQIFVVMPPTKSLVLLCHEGNNPLSGEYSNLIRIRKRSNGMFTLWVQVQSSGHSLQDCWQKNIRTPRGFVEAAQSCLEFCDFGEVGIVALAASAMPVLRKLDERFANCLGDFLREENDDRLLSDSSSKAVTRVVRKGRHSLTFLSKEDALKEYGQSLTLFDRKTQSGK